ncbi:hypothetical protein G9272_24000 [Streptomyces asoensis]|uniref:Uncharacterized protein n=1 Tax=Streptomyces asoensis TaxID=249586 RepID=A0A6M4WTJ5_9ACTN|nr:hypothetical protein [Streptomyces asoensis]QJT02971.1 hypothetical protein G9272_24000 [Streptomyces asoensis]
MATVGWAAVIVTSIGGLIFVLSYLLEQVPPLSDKAVEAIAAVRRLIDAWRGGEQGPPPGM